MPTAVPMSNSGGSAQPDNGSTPATAAGGQKKSGGIPAGKAGGQITISRAESAALSAFETEPAERAMKRASAESGLTPNQIRKLKARADRARQGGFTLVGGNITLKATNHPEATDENGLLRDGDGADEDAAEKVGKKATPAAKKAPAAKKPAAKKAKESADATATNLDKIVETMVTEALGGETV